MSRRHSRRLVWWHEPKEKVSSRVRSFFTIKHSVSVRTLKVDVERVVLLARVS